jgi:hypothetical protein
MFLAEYNIPLVCSKEFEFPDTAYSIHKFYCKYTQNINLAYT